MTVKRLSSIGKISGEVGDTTIEVSVNEEAKTLTISDRGIGMTAEEVKKYINQIAFSGAFFFQAEDGIRDLYVTGVQTCALPISSRRHRLRGLAAEEAHLGQRRRGHGRA